MKSFALERLDSEVFDEKSKHTNFGKTECLEYNNILLDNFRFAFGIISGAREPNKYYNINRLHVIEEMATSFDESYIEEIDLFNEHKFYKFNYMSNKLIKFSKIIAIDTNICYKIRAKKFNLNRTMIREMKNESKQNPNI